LVIGILFAAPKQIWAYEGIPPELEMNALNPFLAYAIPLEPMHAGVWEAKIAPGYIVDNWNSPDSGNVNATAWGVTGSMTRALSEHWGINALASYTSIISGHADVRDVSTMAGFGPGSFPYNFSYRTCVNGVNCQGAVSGDGFLGAINLIWDFRSGDGFRFPILLGLSYVDASGTTDDTSAAITRTGKVQSPGVSVGLAPSCNIWRFRTSVFGMYTYALQNVTGSLTYNGTPYQHVEFTIPGESYRQTMSEGVQISYRPFKLLSFTYIPPLGATASTYIFTLTKRWGGESSKSDASGSSASTPSCPCSSANPVYSDGQCYPNSQAACQGNNACQWQLCK
jgi:hypothetical protein